MLGGGKMKAAFGLISVTDCAGPAPALGGPVPLPAPAAESLPPAQPGTGFGLFVFVEHEEPED